MNNSNSIFVSNKLKIECILIILFIIICSILQNYYNSLLLLTVICYVLCCRRMLKSYTNNIKLLQLQLEILQNTQINYDTNDDINNIIKQSPAQIKLNIFTNFQKAIIIFISFKIIFYWISSLLLYEYPWINDIILNLITISFIIFLFYNFRMNRSFKPYFYLIDQNVDKWIEIKNKIKNNSKSFKNYIKI